MNKISIYIFTIFAFITSNCKSQTNKPSIMTNRQAIVAGKFYPSNKKELNNQLESIFNNAIPQKTNDIIAIISPHAGYIYSGEVAASAFNQIDIDKNYETIFIIGASHVAYFNGASIYNKGNYITPLGEVEVDTALANKIIKDNPLFGLNSSYHLEDHCIEVQLPFLQYKMKTKFKIIPIIIGTDSEDICKKLANTLAPYFNNKNLFVFSSDFSHYPNYKDAVLIDKITCDAILSNSANSLINIVKSNDTKKISNLTTSICGYNAILTMLYITENLKNITIEPINYKNSGDYSHDSSRVVGYWALTVSEKDNSSKSINIKEDIEFQLSEKDKKDLLNIARTTLESYINKGITPQLNDSLYSNKLKEQCGAFVTLKINGNLRGCIGRFMPNKPLYQIVQEMTIAAATQDYRFEKVTSKELNSITIEISVLSPLQEIKSINEIIMGKHGIYIKKGGKSGTFLPQVADETAWTKEEFLGHCAEDKAGIGWYGWKTAEIYIYTAIIINE